MSDAETVVFFPEGAFGPTNGGEVCTHRRTLSGHFVGDFFRRSPRFRGGGGLPVGFEFGEPVRLSRPNLGVGSDLLGQESLHPEKERRCHHALGSGEHHGRQVEAQRQDEEEDRIARVDVDD